MKIGVNFMYKIKEVLKFKNKHNMEFTVGLVIEGPRGGKYLLDEFCAEQWLKSKYREKPTEEIYTSIQKLVGTLHRSGRITVCYADLDGHNDFVIPAKYKGTKVFRRLAGLSELRKTGIMDKISIPGEQTTENKNIRTMEFIGLDAWSRPVYRCVETGQLWKDITLGEKEPELYSCGNDLDGEPDSPIKSQLQIIYKNKYQENVNTFNYKMLGRLRRDCDYYLGYGHRSKNALYYKDERKHIDEMKRLYKGFPNNAKPEWLTWEQILEYERQMVKGG